MLTKESSIALALTKLSISCCFRKSNVDYELITISKFYTYTNHSIVNCWIKWFNIINS